MRVWSRGVLPVLGLVVVLSVVLGPSSGPEPAASRAPGPGSTTIEDAGVRWRFDGRDVVVAVTSKASAGVRRRLKGDVAVGCSRVPLLGSRSETATGIGATRFPRIPGSVRVRLAPRITRADVCFIERKRGSSDVAGVRFPADAYASTSGGSRPSDPERAAIVATLVRHFDAKIARDRRSECATYTENAAEAVAAFQRQFLRRPQSARDCLSAYRELDRAAGTDALRVVSGAAVEARDVLRVPEQLDLTVKNGRARVARTGTTLDFGYEVIRVDGRWLIDRLPR